MTEIQITYKTVVRKLRTGPVGKLLGLLAEHPVRAGLVGGVAVVAIAGLRAHQGVMNAPAIALLLSLVVIASWTMLFYMMRAFFEAQRYVHVYVIRAIELADDVFVWKESGRVLKTIPDPQFSIYTNPVPSEILDTRSKKDLPWPVWLVVDAADEESDTFVLHTKVTATEANGFDTVPDSIANAIDDELPVQTASPLLMLVRG